MRRLTILIVMLSVFLLSLSTVAAQTTPTAPSLEISNLALTPGFSDFDVDIEVTGQPCFSLFEGASRFYWDLPTGALNVKIYRPVGFATTCSGPLLAEYNINYVAGQFYTVFIYRDTADNAAFSLFQNDVSPIPSGQSRMLVRNGVGLQPNITLAFRLPSSNRPHIVSVENGAQVVLELPAGDWQISLMNPPSAVIPSLHLSQTDPFGAGELWNVEVGGPVPLGAPVNGSGIAIWDYKYSR